MQERPVPPSTPGEQNSPAYLWYALNRQARKRGKDTPTTAAALKTMLREQSGGGNVQPSAHIKSLFERLNANDITPDLFLYALDMSPYAPTEDNGALRPEDYDDDDPL